MQRAQSRSNDVIARGSLLHIHTHLGGRGAERERVTSPFGIAAGVSGGDGVGGAGRASISCQRETGPLTEAGTTHR